MYWPLAEVQACQDQPVALFYALLDDQDRALLSRDQIDIHGDLRPA